MNYTNRALDSETAVEYMSNMLALRRGFYIMTDDGRIAVEGTVEKDPLKPVLVVPWENRPDTEWCINQHNEVADWYISIGINPNASFDYIRILAAYAIAEVRYTNKIKRKISDRLLDATVLGYIMGVEKTPSTFIKERMQEYTDIHYTLKPNTVETSHVNYILNERLRNAATLLSRVSPGYRITVFEIAYTYDTLMEIILDWLTR